MPVQVLNPNLSITQNKNRNRDLGFKLSMTTDVYLGASPSNEANI